VSRSWGAERVIRYRDEDFAAAALAWTQGHGLHAALDNVGAEVLRRTFAAMAPYGRVVTLTGLRGDTDDGTAYVKNLTLHAVMMLTPMWLGLGQALAHQGQIVGEGLRLMAEGRLQILFEATYPLDQVAEAHRRLEAGGVAGKLMLTITG